MLAIACFLVQRIAAAERGKPLLPLLAHLQISSGLACMWGEGKTYWSKPRGFAYIWVVREIRVCETQEIVQLRGVHN